MYYRKVEITRYAGTGVVCDPWYYVCGTYPVEAVLGSRGGWDFGFNIGAGVGFGLGDSGEFYIESKYRYVMGPEIMSATTAADLGRQRRQRQRPVSAADVRLPVLGASGVAA